MKTYPFEVDGKEYALTGLTIAAKDKFCQPIRAEHLNRLKGMLADGLIEATQYVDLTRSAVDIGFADEPVVRAVATIEGRKRLLKLLLVNADKLEAGEFDRIWATADDPDSSLSKAVLLVTEAAYPPKVTPPASTPE